MKNRFFLLICLCLFFQMTKLEDSFAAHACEALFQGVKSSNLTTYELAGNENFGLDSSRNPYAGSGLFRQGSHFAMVNPIQFERLALPRWKGRQRRNNWCWAASAQMLLNHAGYPVNQEIFSLLKNGYIQDQPGSMLDTIQVIRRLNRVKNLNVSFDLVPREAPHLIRQFLLNRPLMVFLDLGGEIGHFVVLEGVTYDFVFGQPIIRTLVFRDPEPSMPSTREVNWEWFSHHSAPLLLSIF